MADKIQESLDRMSGLATKTTEQLEAEMRALSTKLDETRLQIQEDQGYFLSIGAELKRRRESGEETFTVREPVGESAQARENKLREEARMLTLKITSMEAEQAKLVVEAETAKAVAREANERLALVTKHQLPQGGA